VNIIKLFPLQMKGFFAIHMNLIKVLAILDAHLPDFHFIFVFLQLHLVLKFEILSVEDQLNVPNSLCEGFVQTLSN
jgi:hypothetical protein